VRPAAGDADIGVTGVAAPSEVNLNRTRQQRAALNATFALMLVVVQVTALRLVPWEPAVRVILPATIAAVPVALWTYRRWAGTWVIFVGLAANLAVILANGGLMPIERATVVEAIGEEQAARYAPGDWITGSKDVLVSGGRLTPLGDGIVVHVGPGGFVASPGDIVVWSGLLVLAAEASIAWQRSQRLRRRALETPPSARGATKAEGGAAT
jgi:uncharacterized protein DUF5317